MLLHLGTLKQLDCFWYFALSENGYYVASAAAGNEIKIWDLRKLKEIKSIVMREDDYVVNALK